MYTSTLPTMKLTTPSKPNEQEFESLKVGLTKYNELVTGPVLSEEVSSFVKNESGLILGGILGEINWDWMYIKGLWVDESIRKSGWGEKLLQSLEQYSVSKGVPNIRLETTTFQALDFYLKCGYSIFGELPNMPKGHTSYFLQKQIAI